jgi:hypothetical protein
MHYLLGMSNYCQTMPSTSVKYLLSHEFSPFGKDLRVTNFCQFFTPRNSSITVRAANNSARDRRSAISVETACDNVARTRMS